ILLKSSPFTRLINTPNYISLQMVEEQPDPNKFRTQPVPVTVLLEGQFPYLFANRPTPDGLDTPVDLTAISHPAKKLVMADVDWLINEVKTKNQSPLSLNWDRYSEQKNTNKFFLEDIIDH